MSEHASSVKTYILIFLALMVLTAVTVWVAFLHLGPFNDIVAMAIAIIKATLVVLFFMHVKGSARLTKIVVLSGLFWLAILVGLILTDYMSRGAVPGGPVVF